jgi:5-methylcytosine-specific restriction endonuclease McrA
MTASRTGTTSHKKWRTRVLHLARAAGQTNCPDCGQPLAWGTTRQPTSPEPDHITPYAQGGTDTIDNARVTCRRCNQSRGDKPINWNKPQHNNSEKCHTIGNIDW